MTKQTTKKAQAAADADRQWREKRDAAVQSYIGAATAAAEASGSDSHRLRGFLMSVFEHWRAAR